MNKYYNMELDCEPKIIGVRNGVYQVVLIEKLYSQKALEEMNAFFHTPCSLPNLGLPNFDVHFHFMRLKTMKETSFISFCPYLNHCLFIINDSVVDIIKEFNIQSYQLYPTTLYNKGSDIGSSSYKMFFSILQEVDIIDFSKSVFVVGGYSKYPLEECIFSSNDELLAFHADRKMFFPKIRKMVLNEKFDSSLDLFQARLGGIFVSERLKLTLEANKVTGLIFSDSVDVQMAH